MYGVLDGAAIVVDVPGTSMNDDVECYIARSRCKYAYHTDV